MIKDTQKKKQAKTLFFHKDILLNIKVREIKFGTGVQNNHCLSFYCLSFYFILKKTGNF